ncbi:hypothetical protein PhCBS80983_g06331 [Powellomyces hirtus]|uniref:Uncharacterized protein n=1 Tax=Powellomyces hirtus TaxID=109895 RepID=A0A507DPB1_9FUNG|nr:hypothetical protein PhCBS80983_g06331 [Powellomyces hirtus]
MSENIGVYRTIKETFDSRAAANPIKLVIDSNSSFLRPQRSYLSARVTLFNQDGSLFKTANLSQTGVMSIFKSASLKVGGKVVDNIEDYGMLVMDNYGTSSVAEKKTLKYNEAYSRPDVFQNDNQLVTPSAEYLSALWKGIQAGKYLEIDTIDVNQIQNTCYGATQQSFILPLANARVIGISSRFRSDADYATGTGDKSQIFSTQGLKSWRIQIGQYRLPLTEDFLVDDTLIVRGLSMNDNEFLQ